MNDDGSTRAARVVAPIEQRIMNALRAAQALINRRDEKVYADRPALATILATLVPMRKASEANPIGDLAKMVKALEKTRDSLLAQYREATPDTRLVDMVEEWRGMPSV